MILSGLEGNRLDRRPIQVEANDWDLGDTNKGRKEQIHLTAVMVELGERKKLPGKVVPCPLPISM